MPGGPAKCIGVSGFTAGCCMLHSRVGVPGLRQRASPLWGTWGRGLPEGRGSSLLTDDKSERATPTAQEVASEFLGTVLGTYLPRLPTRTRCDSNVCDAITIDRESVPDSGDVDICGGGNETYRFPVTFCSTLSGDRPGKGVLILRYQWLRDFRERPAEVYKVRLENNERVAERVTVFRGQTNGYGICFAGPGGLEE